MLVGPLRWFPLTERHFVIGAAARRTTTNALSAALPIGSVGPFTTTEIVAVQSYGLRTSACAQMRPCARDKRWREA